MKAHQLIKLIREVSEVDDALAKELIPELLVISLLPEASKVNTITLIGLVVDECERIKKIIPSFDFSLWSGETVIETIDFLITHGAIEGPMVDLDDESHVLLESDISRSDSTGNYEAGLVKELWEFTPEAKEK